MTFIADLIDAGFWPLQHQDAKFAREQRVTRFGCRVIEHPELFLPVPADNSTGPVMGGFLWGSLDYQEQPPIWSFAAPVVKAPADAYDGGFVERLPTGGAVTSKSWKLEKAGDWQGTEPLLESKELVTPFELNFPLEWPGVALCSVNPDVQNDLVLPGFAGLVAPHMGGSRDLGTAVWDVAADGTVDDMRMARLQSMMRVYRYPTAGACTVTGAGLEAGGLAWQLGEARTGIAGSGVVADSIPSLTTVARDVADIQVLAIATARGGGPLHVGGLTDKHKVGQTPDGEAMNSLHLSTSSLFLGHGGDAPLFFEGPRLKENKAPLTVPAHLRYDAAGKHRTPCGAYDGLWVFQAESFIAKIPDRFPPPEDDNPPPRTEPREDGTTTGDGTSSSGGDGWVAGGGMVPSLAPEQQVRQLAGTPMELAAPGFVFRPQSLSTAAIDLRNLPPSMFTAEAERQWSEAPAVLRLESAGTMTGPEWSRTTEPGRGRYAAGGTGSGTLWAMAPELGLELAGVSGLTTSTSALGLWDVSLEFGAPDTGGAIDSGWRISRQTAGNYLNIYSVSGGAATGVMAFQPGTVVYTADVVCRSDLTVNGNLYIGATANPTDLVSTATVARVQTMRDRTLTVGAHLIDTAASGTIGTAATLKSYRVDTSAAGATITLPAASTTGEDEIEVFDATGQAGAGNTIVISRSGSDTIRGATSYTISSAYGAAKFRSDGASKWAIVATS